MNIKYPILLKYYRILTQLLAHNETLKAALQIKQAIIDERDFEINKLKSDISDTFTLCSQCNSYRLNDDVSQCELCGMDVCQRCINSYTPDYLWRHNLCEPHLLEVINNA